MVTSETGQLLTVIRSSALFPCTRTHSPVQNPLQWTKLDRFVQACSVCAAPSGTLLFPLNCFFPMTQLSDLPSLPCYTNPVNFLLQKLFQFCKVDRSTNSVKSDSQFSRKFSIRLVDSALILIINYKKYRKVLLSERSYYAVAEVE